MTIPSPVYDPPFNITRASHVVLTVRDLAARGITTDAIETVGEGARKARTRDPDGNNVDVIDVAS